MRTISATTARKNIYGLIDQAIESSEPILVTGKRGNAVLLSEDDYRSIEETLYLVSIPGMKDSILEGLNTPLDECEDGDDIDWNDTK